MSIDDLPPELGKLMGDVVGMPWPQSNSGWLRHAGELYTEFANDIDQLTDYILEAIDLVLSSFVGESADAFVASMRDLIGQDGGQDYLAQAQTSANQLANIAQDAANAVEYAKIMIVAQLVLLLAQITFAIFWAPFTGGLSLEEIIAAILGSREAIMKVLAWLAKTIAMHTVAGIAGGTVLSLAIQGVQIAEHHQSKVDGSEVLQGVEFGVMSEIAAVPLDLVGLGVGELIGNVVGKSAGAVLGTKLATALEDATDLAAAAEKAGGDAAGVDTALLAGDDLGSGSEFSPETLLSDGAHPADDFPGEGLPVGGDGADHATDSGVGSGSDSPTETDTEVGDGAGGEAGPNVRTVSDTSTGTDTNAEGGEGAGANGAGNGSRTGAEPGDDADTRPVTESGETAGEQRPAPGSGESTGEPAGGPRLATGSGEPTGEPHPSADGGETAGGARPATESGTGADRPGPGGDSDPGAEGTPEAGKVVSTSGGHDAPGAADDVPEPTHKPTSDGTTTTNSGGAPHDDPPAAAPAPESGPHPSPKPELSPKSDPSPKPEPDPKPAPKSAPKPKDWVGPVESKAFAQDIGKTFAHVRSDLEMGFKRSGAGSHAKYLETKMGEVFQHHLSALFEDGAAGAGGAAASDAAKVAAGKAGRDFGAAFVKQWGQKGAHAEDLESLLQKSLEGAGVIDKNVINVLSKKLPELADEMSGAGNLLYKLGHFVVDELLNGAKNVLTTVFYDLAFQHGQVDVGASSFYGGLVGGLLTAGGHLVLAKVSVKWANLVHTMQSRPLDPDESRFLPITHPLSLLSVLSNLSGIPAPFPVARPGERLGDSGDPKGIGIPRPAFAEQWAEMLGVHRFFYGKGGDGGDAPGDDNWVENFFNRHGLGGPSDDADAPSEHADRFQGLDTPPDRPRGSGPPGEVPTAPARDPGSGDRVPSGPDDDHAGPAGDAGAPPSETEGTHPEDVAARLKDLNPPAAEPRNDDPLSRAPEAPTRQPVGDDVYVERRIQELDRIARDAGMPGPVRSQHSAAIREASRSREWPEAARLLADYRDRVDVRVLAHRLQAVESHIADGFDRLGALGADHEVWQARVEAVREARRAGDMDLQNAALHAYIAYVERHVPSEALTGRDLPKSFEADLFRAYQELNDAGNLTPDEAAAARLNIRNLLELSALRGRFDALTDHSGDEETALRQRVADADSADEAYSAMDAVHRFREQEDLAARIERLKSDRQSPSLEERVAALRGTDSDPRELELQRLLDEATTAEDAARALGDLQQYREEHALEERLKSHLPDDETTSDDVDDDDLGKRIQALRNDDERTGVLRKRVEDATTAASARYALDRLHEHLDEQEQARRARVRYLRARIDKLRETLTGHLLGGNSAKAADVRGELGDLQQRLDDTLSLSERQAALHAELRTILDRPEHEDHLVRIVDRGVAALEKSEADGADPRSSGDLEKLLGSLPEVPFRDPDDDRDDGAGTGDDLDGRDEHVELDERSKLSDPVHRPVEEERDAPESGDSVPSGSLTMVRSPEQSARDDTSTDADVGPAPVPPRPGDFVEDVMATLNGRAQPTRDTPSELSAPPTEPERAPEPDTVREPLESDSTSDVIPGSMSGSVAEPPAAVPDALEVPRDGHSMIYAALATAGPQLARRLYSGAENTNPGKVWLADLGGVRRDLAGIAAGENTVLPEDLMVRIRSALDGYLFDGLVSHRKGERFKWPDEIVRLYRTTVGNAHVSELAHETRRNLLKILPQLGVSEQTRISLLDGDEMRARLLEWVRTSDAHLKLGEVPARAVALREANVAAMSHAEVIGYLKQLDLLPPSEELSLDNLRKLALASYVTSDAPLLSEEVHELAAIVRRWTEGSSEPRGEVLLPLLAHSLNLRVRVRRHGGAGGEQEYGPVAQDAQRVTFVRVAGHEGRPDYYAGVEDPEAEQEALARLAEVPEAAAPPSGAAARKVEAVARDAAREAARELRDEALFAALAEPVASTGELEQETPQPAEEHLGPAGPAVVGSNVLEVPRNGFSVISSVLATAGPQLARRLYPKDHGPEDPAKLWLGDLAGVRRDLAGVAAVGQGIELPEGLMHRVGGAVREYLWGGYGRRGQKESFQWPDEVVRLYRSSPGNRNALDLAHETKGNLLKVLPQLGVGEDEWLSVFSADEMRARLVEWMPASPAYLALGKGEHAKALAVREANLAKMTDLRLLRLMKQADRLPTIEELSVEQLRRLAVASYAASTVPLLDAEIETLTETVGAWANGSAEPLGEGFLPLLAHALNLRIRVQRGDVVNEYGPAGEDAQRVTFVHVAGDPGRPDYYAGVADPEAEQAGLARLAATPEVEPALTGAAARKAASNAAWEERLAASTAETEARALRDPAVYKAIGEQVSSTGRPARETSRPGAVVEVPRDGFCIIYSALATAAPQLARRLYSGPDSRDPVRSWLEDLEGVRRDLGDIVAGKGAKLPDGVIDRVRRAVAGYVADGSTSAARGTGFRWPVEIVRQYRTAAGNTHVAGFEHASKQSLLNAVRRLGVPDDAWLSILDRDWLRTRFVISMREVLQSAALAEEIFAETSDSQLVQQLKQLDLLPSLDSLPVDDLRKLAAGSYATSTAPLLEEETAEIISTISRWDNAWSSPAGEVLLPLLAHALNLRIRVWRRGVSNSGFEYGPENGHPVSFYHDVGTEARADHYNGVVSAGEYAPYSSQWLDQRVEAAAASLQEGDGRGACVTRLAALIGDLYPGLRTRAPAAVSTGRVLDDSVLDTDVENSLVPGAQWRRFFSWDDVARAVDDAGVGATGLVLLRRWDGEGHAIALSRLSGPSSGAPAEAVRWIEMQAADRDGRVRTSAPDEAAFDVRAVILDRYGAVVSGASPAQSTSQPAALLDPPHTYRRYGSSREAAGKRVDEVRRFAPPAYSSANGGSPAVGDEILSLPDERLREAALVQVPVYAVPVPRPTIAVQEPRTLQAGTDPAPGRGLRLTLQDLEGVWVESIGGKRTLRELALELVSHRESASWQRGTQRTGDRIATATGDSHLKSLLPDLLARTAAPLELTDPGALSDGHGELTMIPEIIAWHIAEPGEGGTDVGAQGGGHTRVSASRVEWTLAWQAGSSGRIQARTFEVQEDALVLWVPTSRLEDLIASHALGHDDIGWVTSSYSNGPYCVEAAAVDISALREPAPGRAPYYRVVAVL
jgi:hypothetical protein